MRKLLPVSVLACAIAAPAQASDEELSDRAASENWSLSASGGATLVDGNGDQPFLRFGVTRFVGDGYLRGSVTHFSTRDGAGLIDAVPATTLQASLGGGYRFGAIGIDGYAAIGWRKFRKEAYRRRTGADITIDSHGTTLAGGLSLTYEWQLDKRSVLAPFAAVDLNRIDTARAIVVTGRGTIAQKERQNGTTGSLGLTLDRSLGRESEHRIEAYGAFVTTSNSAVAIRSSAPVAAARLFGPQDIPGSTERWGEYGASATLRLAAPLRLDLSAVRTAGYDGGETTSLYAGLRYHF